MQLKFLLWMFQRERNGCMEVYGHDVNGVRTEWRINGSLDEMAVPYKVTAELSSVT